MNGQLTAGNVFLWDIDDNVGELSTTNVYRYSRNMLFGVNAQWFLGRSGRFTDPYLLSRAAALQRTRVHVHVRNLEVDWTERAAVAYATAAFVFSAYERIARRACRDGR